jgi:RimJ/RimL family protein N-acetyltransferase
MTGEEDEVIVTQVATQPTIDAGRFVLRPLRKPDTGLLALYAGDARVARDTRSIPHPLPPGAIEAFVARSLSEARRETVWAMDGSASGLAELLGVITLRDMERGQSEVSYWVAPAFWNAGYASDAVKALIAANPRSDKAVFAEVFQDNPASARVLTNAGFEYLGDAETFSVARDAMVRTWTYIRKL